MSKLIIGELERLFKELEVPLKKYEEYREKRMATGFNVFYLISDYYYRETFHSDIIAALLSPDEKHGEGNLYIDLFIDMINKANIVSTHRIKKENYDNCIVVKEFPTNDGSLTGRIDILIKGDKNCIVIENKLNNAPDTYQQIPKYYRDLTKKRGLAIDAFVYLPLDSQKKPDSSLWDDESRNFINERLVIIPAYSLNQINLVKDWLGPAEEKSNNNDVKFIIKQYKSLLNNLTIDIMDNKEILDILSNEDNFETTINILSLQNEFVNKIKVEFIKDLQSRIDSLSGYTFSYGDGKDRFYITNSQFPSWRFTIERYSNNQWWRGLYYDGEKAIDEVNWIKAWSKHGLKDYPLGWEYFEEEKVYWEKPQTLVVMRNGTFVSEIAKEIEEAFLEVERQDLPK